MSEIPPGISERERRERIGVPMIPLTRPFFDSSEEEGALRVLRSGWVGQGEEVAAFEQEFARYTGAHHAVAVSSCTAALHLSVLAAGIGPGDEVIVPAFTWISTASAVELSGARAVFCDVGATDFNISVDDFVRKVTPRTKAVIPVHQFGLAAEIANLVKECNERGLTLIEDAACALGTEVETRSVGTFGEFGCFSFHPRKSITTGEGGMVVVRQEPMRRLLRCYRDIGADRDGVRTGFHPSGGLPEFPVLGLNYRMTDLQAAVGRSQLRKLPEIVRMRRELADLYRSEFSVREIDVWLRAPGVTGGGLHSFQAFVGMLTPSCQDSDTIDRWARFRNDILQGAAECGIQMRPGTHAPAFLSYFRGKYAVTPSDFPNAWNAERLSLALPLYAGMSWEDVRRVCVFLEKIGVRRPTRV
ncbi:MAG: DegT/DnrJ/EryC1/StrS family aminotransferase [Thermoanaerobaculia bacterium]|nr:DegT/DnrJ/EryC1/StrS family aminotransferase [Thermoanaerobaculia bacterium]